MAKRVVLTDDLDGSEENVTSFLFSWDGVEYSIDLSAKNLDELHRTMSRYVDAAERQAGSTTRQRSDPKPAPPEPPRESKARESKDRLATIRAWAKSNGYQVSDRGRIARSIRDAFEKAHADL